MSTSIASSLLAGVAVVDARPFFLGGIVCVAVVAMAIGTDYQAEVVLLCLHRRTYVLEKMKAASLGFWELLVETVESKPN